MNILKAGLCLLPSFLLVIFSFGSVRSSSDCKGKDCRPGIECPGPYNCTCAKGSSGEYELLCPAVGEFVLSVSIMPDKYVQIQCTYATRYTDYDLLRGLKVGPVTTVNFRLCPLPHMSLAELTKTIGINSTNTLLFQSYRNLSNSLERKHLAGLGNVTRLLLSSNGLTDLPEYLLQDLFNLTWLDLRGNNVHLHKNFFVSVPKLEVLELGNNDLTHLDEGVFANLTKLKFLNIWKNQLENLTRNVFSDLTSLEQLDISSNKLKSLPADVFQDLKKLVKLSIYANDFSSIPEGLFASTPKLEIIRLYDNKRALTLPNYFLANLTQLKEIYLMRNNLLSIPENVFWNSSAVANISLQGNSLREIPQELFRDQIYLKNLDLSYNQLELVPNYAFKSLVRLQFLKLGYNRLQNISRDVFQGLNELESLDLEHNQLNYLDSEAFGPLEQLKHARLSHNLLSFKNEENYPQGGLPYTDIIGNQSPFRHCFKLEYLYLANNSIKDIFDDWRINLLQIRVLDLSHNKIQHLIIQDIQFIPDDISVDLRHNNISVINLQGIEALSVGQWDGPHSPRRSKRNVRVLLEGNPLNCDCRAYELVRYFENKLQPEVNLFVTLKPGNLTCHQPEFLRGKLMKDIDSRDLTCELEEETCPPGCECLLRRADWGLIVNCTDHGLEEIPSKLPRIRYTNHTELILDGNAIRKLPNTNVGYENVTHLHLSRNNITTIDVGFLSPKLEILTVDNNNITKLSSELIKFLSNSTDIRFLTLHNNPWVCDCSTRELLNLIQLKFKQIPFLSNVTCTSDKRPLSKLSVSDLCPVSVVVIVSCVVIAAFGILIGSVAALYYRYQREVKVWLYSHRFCLWLVTEQELDKDKLYDAFVSYSHKDEDFVINTLVPELESGDTPFKLCLHYRDWIAGEWIPNQIARSVEDSRRTLVVLSPNFLESVWGRMEFRAAHKQALSEGRARVIVILYGDVGPTDQLDPELRAYISMNTYVKWGDPWFWGKLKYALPHPPSLVKNNLNLLKRRGSRKEKKYLDDKLELIHTLDSPTTPPGATTPPAEAAVTTMETFTAIPNGNNIGNGQIKALA